MRVIALVLFFCVLSFVSPRPAGASFESIAVVVNEDAISLSDVNDRMKLVMISSGLPDNKEIRSKVLPQVVASLIDEQIMLQEARRLEVQVDQAEIDQGFNTIAQQNKYDPNKFKAALKASGINVGTMERQIESQIAWGKVIQQQIRPQVNVNDADIDAYIERLHGDKGKSEYLVAEIFLPVDSPEKESNTRQLADRLVREVNAGKAPFFKMAQQFSKAPGAASGGDMGWVRQGQLPQELDEALSGLETGKISAPVRTVNGYHILLLRDRRAITDETIPSRDEVLSRIGVERLERAQRRYLMDLKAAAFIENRVGS